ncbi:bile acid:sodium symporter family protein [Nostocoides sp. F2B08]|uniref:bile acid:sodium symporter family protein n=1 Tax=Nostocoides sp. F2B08 TaxID=2653936 RepID=UPI001263E29F|nr:bile acid:sodium symporter family protein [Tetrasphaera sp. F2B08]KAB7741384.1 bile acid:sodium symporter family protein [Tetrasphaera sp. F2B08]
MDSTLVTVGLPVGLAVIMLGLGLSLTPADFRRVAQAPKAVVVALTCQILVLPLVAFGLVLLFDLPPLLAVGFMILAASPGGSTANLYSHLFHGDVALNISLTAINSLIAVVTLPVVTNLALGFFVGEDDGIGLQFGKLVQVFAIVLIPVAVGMLVRSRAVEFAARMNRPVRIASVILLVLIVAGAVYGERETLLDYVAEVGLIAIAFCAISLSVGYAVPRLLGLGEAQAIASSFEIGIHNATLAIAMAVTVLQSTEMAVPPAIYGIVMFFVAAAFGVLFSRGGRVRDLEDQFSTQRESAV